MPRSNAFRFAGFSDHPLYHSEELVSRCEVGQFPRATEFACTDLAAARFSVEDIEDRRFHHRRQLDSTTPTIESF